MYQVGGRTWVCMLSAAVTWRVLFSIVLRLGCYSPRFLRSHTLFNKHCWCCLFVLLLILIYRSVVTATSTAGRAWQFFLFSLIFYFFLLFVFVFFSSSSLLIAHNNLVSLWRGCGHRTFTPLGLWRIGTDTGCAGCRQEEKTVQCKEHTTIFWVPAYIYIYIPSSKLPRTLRQTGIE